MEVSFDVMMAGNGFTKTTIVSLPLQPCDVAVNTNVVVTISVADGLAIVESFSRIPGDHE